jgi:peptidoglycan-associated lipoprotein
MKKVLLVTGLIFVLVFILGCPKPAPPPPVEEQPVEVDTTTPPPPPPPPPQKEEVKPVQESEFLTIYFDFDKSNIREDQKPRMEKNAAILKANPNLVVRIEGNCDERDTYEYNLALGDRRANAVKDYFIKLGIPADRLETISYGEERPVDPGHNEAAWAKNRRDDFKIIRQ